MKKIWKILLIIAGLMMILATVAGCGGGGDEGNGAAAVTLKPEACPAGNTTNVAIPGLTFSPAAITVSTNGS